MLAPLAVKLTPNPSRRSKMSRATPQSSPFCTHRLTQSAYLTHQQPATTILPWVSYRILASAGAAQDLHAWRDLIRFVFGRGGMLRGRWHAVAAYHRRDFHPWRYLDNRRFLSELRDTIVDPTWEVRAR